MAHRGMVVVEGETAPEPEAVGALFDQRQTALPAGRGGVARVQRGAGDAERRATASRRGPAARSASTGGVGRRRPVARRPPEPVGDGGRATGEAAQRVGALLPGAPGRPAVAPLPG
ncbi:hypothetical protein [Streptomyces sp. NPDC005336]|uniref:hypothetical protein n=1 Tax=unclassified Streptomyces TaxID=2593676 RepID=UPI0033B7D03E